MIFGLRCFLEASTVSEYSICSCNSGNISDVSKQVDCSFLGNFSKHLQVGTSQELGQILISALSFTLPTHIFLMIFSITILIYYYFPFCG